MPVHHTPQTTNLLEVLEKILDKGVVIAGDIKIALADVDLLTIKIRLLVASVDKAREIGLDWWERDSYYSSKARIIEEEHALLKDKINRLEQQLNEQKALPPKIEKKPLLQVYIESDPNGKEEINQHSVESSANIQKEERMEENVEESTPTTVIEDHEVTIENKQVHLKKNQIKKHPGKP
jgi:uncharacterized protein (DUF342 family)